MTTVREARAALTRRMIGPAIPRLWCPPLTHYTPEGKLDLARMRAHWATMRDAVGGFLVPGSTGDGWEMTEDEIADLLDVALDLATALDTRVLIGALRSDVAAMREVIAQTVARARAATGRDAALDALAARHIAGFTVCAPRGSDLAQAEIHGALAEVLALGLPTAIYQLPQVTQNEISPGVFKSLAADYPNLILFKDSSGTDRVAQADHGESGVFLMRGAEGDYAAWLKAHGGCYDGFLLSTANCFAGTLDRILQQTAGGDLAGAQALAAQLTAVVTQVFDLVADCPHGNAFANANKAVDHVMAYGTATVRVPPPMLHAGERLPAAVVRATVDILADAGFMPERGYLAAEA